MSEVGFTGIAILLYTDELDGRYVMFHASGKTSEGKAHLLHMPVKISMDILRHRFAASTDALLFPRR
jgi:hypothetical protein